MTPAEHSVLISIQKKFRPYVDARDREGYHELNKSFHDAIYAGAHNDYLKEQAAALYGRLSPYRAYHLKRPDALRRASNEHEAIVDAIIAGDGDEAHRLLVNHVSLSNELFSDLVAALSSAETVSTR